MYTATMFYREKDWLEDKPCFDWRMDSQVIPSGSIVCGFFVLDSIESGEPADRVRSVVKAPHMNEEQRKDFDRVFLEITEAIREDLYPEHGEA